MTRDEYVAFTFDKRINASGEAVYIEKYRRGLKPELTEDQVTDNYEEFIYLSNKLDRVKLPERLGVSHFDSRCVVPTDADRLEAKKAVEEAKVVARKSNAYARSHFSGLALTKKSWKARLKEAVLECYGKWRPNAEN